MKTTIGGDRLGSGAKMDVYLKNYGRSTHDLSYIWRSSMSSGTLVPFMKTLALPGDSFDIKLDLDAKTLPTIGPLFGSYKIQADVYSVPIRLYNAKLHMNMLGVGLDMSQIYLPKVKLMANGYDQGFNDHINPSCLMRYLGVTSLGNFTGNATDEFRLFNAIPLLAYWDIYKNYYANKQEEVGYFIHTDDDLRTAAQTPYAASVYNGNGKYLANVLDTLYAAANGTNLYIYYPSNAMPPDIPNVQIKVGGANEYVTDHFESVAWVDNYKMLVCTGYTGAPDSLKVDTSLPAPFEGEWDSISLKQFDLSVIDEMRENILQYAGAADYQITEANDFPYSCFVDTVGAGQTIRYSSFYSQEGLGIKTYQSDLFNNWLNTEFIDGVNGVNEIASVSTAGDSFTIDAFNLAQKVYVMLNRIAVSGGTFDDWLNTVYTQERVKAIESPVYHGSLIKELAFEEVVSNTNTDVDGESKPLGTLAGRGRLTGKHKGGRMHIRINEPSYIMGIVSITPRVDYSQGNDWDVNLDTFNDFHKPQLSGIGWQDLIAEQLVATDTEVNSTTHVVTTNSIGKQPAWINYMTAVNKTYGNFADENKEMFMTLNRRYEVDANGNIADATTYIDPTKFNQIFADNNLDSQNFWIQIANNITARRKMSAKLIPNL